MPEDTLRSTMRPHHDPPVQALRRSLSLPLVVLYGLGTTVGAGIYALMGEVAGTAGVHAPLSFLIAGVIAGLSGLTFAELSARFPKSAGEAVYVREGLGLRGAPLVVGLMVVLAGSVSAATIANGFVGYLAELLELPQAISVISLIVLLVGIAVWGIGESVRLAGIITLIEVAGLLVVAWAGRDAIPGGATWLVEMPVSWGGVFGGSLLAFYAFLGFEDMVNVAEEVKDAPRTLPRAIAWTLGVTVLLYVLMATVSIGVLPPAVLAESQAPLVHVWEASTGRSGALIAWISIIAMINGALIQIIMASRVLYGLSSQGWLPARLGRVSVRTQTPVFSTVLVGSVVAVLALIFPLGPLARATSTITLVIFALVNAALWRLKREPTPDGVPRVPRFIPVLGMLSAIGLLAVEWLRRLA
jgi:amino acid transporter